MARLPQQGESNWGAVLNDFLLASHHASGALRNQRPVVNARDFGAAGDGTNDDTAALQQAILAASNGGTLFIPAGVYSTSKLLLPSDTTVCGEGDSSILKLRAGTLDALLTNQDWTNGNRHIILRNLRLEGNRQSNDQSRQNFFPSGAIDRDKSHGVNFHYVEESRIEHVTVADFYYDGVYLGTSVPGSYPEGQEDRSSGSNRNAVRDCRIVGNGRNGISITRGTDNTIAGNYLQNNNIGMLDPNPAPFQAGAITIEPNADWDDVSRNIVQGNHLLNNHFNGIQLLKNWTSTGILVSNNVISGTTRHGIAAALVSAIIIQANHISSSGAAGMAIGMGTGVKEAVIAGNTVTSNGSTGILVNGEKGERIIVMGNICTGNSHTDAYGSGIVWVDAKEVTLIGNVALDNGSGTRAQMLAAGVDPIYANNRVGPLGIPASSRTVRDTDFFATYWRMYGSDTDIYLENQRTGKAYFIPISPIA